MKYQEMIEKMASGVFEDIMVDVTSLVNDIEGLLIRTIITTPELNKL